MTMCIISSIVAVVGIICAAIFRIVSDMSGRAYGGYGSYDYRHKVSFQRNNNIINPLESGT